MVSFHVYEHQLFVAVQKLVFGQFVACRPSLLFPVAGAVSPTSASSDTFGWIHPIVVP